MNIHGQQYAASDSFSSSFSLVYDIGNIRGYQYFIILNRDKQFPQMKCHGSILAARKNTHQSHMDSLW